MINVGSPSSINYRKEKYWKTKGYVSLSDIGIGTYIFDKDWVESKVGLKRKESIKQKKYLIKIWIQSCWFKLSDFTHLHLNQCDSLFIITSDHIWKHYGSSGTFACYFLKSGFFTILLYFYTCQNLDHPFVQRWVWLSYPKHVSGLNLKVCSLPQASWPAADNVRKVSQNFCLSHNGNLFLGCIH